MAKYGGFSLCKPVHGISRIKRSNEILEHSFVVFLFLRIEACLKVK